MNSLVTINDQEQTLTIYDHNTKKVASSLPHPLPPVFWDGYPHSSRVLIDSQSNLMFGIVIGVQGSFL
jgi:hypothetical protein